MTPANELARKLAEFRLNDNGTSGHRTLVEKVRIGDMSVDRFVNEFWTSKQRQASSLHEISYRACFKPQLPRFFMERLSRPGDTVLDPFSGRGTTVIEAGLLGRQVISNDVNPLSAVLSRPRLEPPTVDEVKESISSIELGQGKAMDGPDLSMFYHENTQREIEALRDHLLSKTRQGAEDRIERWIRMVATNRLTGHSRGFFSVYTLPPNQAVTPERQVLINKKLDQTPEYRDVKTIILRKTASLLRNVSEKDRMNLKIAAGTARFLEGPAEHLTEVGDGEVTLTVTSPPFMNIVHYSQDNWLRCWFNGIDPSSVERGLTMATTLKEWKSEMGKVLSELYRVTIEGGHVAFEVGEIDRGKLNLEETVVPLGTAAGFECLGILVNLQSFSKTSNIWGVSNNRRGTNTNRVVIFRK
ncbi:MAG: site-specific DNA-methyltransferase [Candidatus Thermoplasmatota archaeon]|nr:site-specific DNA-methyltransferase [Candidatus Thermoplasmatota archaeon]